MYAWFSGYVPAHTERTILVGRCIFVCHIQIEWTPHQTGSVQVMFWRAPNSPITEQITHDIQMSGNREIYSCASKGCSVATERDMHLIKNVTSFWCWQRLLRVKTTWSELKKRLRCLLLFSKTSETNLRCNSSSVSICSQCALPSVMLCFTSAFKRHMNMNAVQLQQCDKLKNGWVSMSRLLTLQDKSTQHAECEGQWVTNTGRNENWSLLTFPSSSNNLSSDLVKQARKREKKW